MPLLVLILKENLDLFHINIKRDEMSIVTTAIK